MPAPNSTDSNFERTFADLAFARLRDKAPSLLDYLIGFQLIDKNDEDTHAIGVFGFKVGGEWVYAPVFFINGELKGHELLYIKGQDAFVPLMEEWVNYILNRRPSVLGEREPTPRGQLGMRQPDFDLFSRVPYTGSKYASERRGFKKICQNMSSDFRPFMDVFLRSPKDVKFAALKTRFDLPTALKLLGKQAAVNLIATMKKDAAFAESILRYYDIRDLVGFEKAAEKLDQTAAGYKPSGSFSLCKDCKNYNNGTCSVVEGDISPEGTCNYFESAGVKDEIEPVKSAELKDKKDQVEFDSAPYRDTPPKGVVVITKGDDTSAVTKDMSDSDKAKLMKDQYVVKDERTDDQKSRLYKSELAATYTGPQGSGMYEVLQPDGSLKDMLIVDCPRKIGCNRSKEFVTIIDIKGKRFGNYHPSDILAGPKKSDIVDIEGLKDPKSLKYDDKAILVGPEGDTTNVFEVENKVIGADGAVEIRVWGKTNASAGSSKLLNAERTYVPQDSSYGDADTTIRSMVITGKEGNKANKIGNTLFVPDTYKVLVVTPGRARSKGPHAVPCCEESDLPLGNITDVLATVSKSAAVRGGVRRLGLRTDGIQFNLVLDGNHGPRMSKLAALRSLIMQHRLGQTDAEFLLKEAQPRKSTTYFIKYCEFAPGPASFPEPNVGSEYGINVPVQYPQLELQNIGAADMSGNRELYRDERYVDDQAKQQAQAASDQGQKEVLDTAVISGLVHTLDTDSRVDSYIGDLLLGLDRLGRILFMFYWHNDKFKDRYGQQDLVDMEDNLRNVFKNLGELTLFLKQKTIEPEEADSSEVELDEVLT